MVVLEANRVAKVYGGRNDTTSTNALKGVDIRISEGEFVGVMGPSGSGKTTLLNILSGIDKPTSGSVKISDREIISLSKDELALFRRKKLGFVFQEFNLLDSLTINENIMLPLILDKKESEELKKTAMDIIDFFDIFKVSDKYPTMVSGGEQQRAAVGRAIANNPHIIFADEPTGNLDSKSSRKVMNSFEKINEERNTTILMVTHDAFAASFCKRIIFIKDGQIHSEISKKGTNREFFDHILDCLFVIGGDDNDI